MVSQVVVTIWLDLTSSKRIKGFNLLRHLIPCCCILALQLLFQGPNLSSAAQTKSSDQPTTNSEREKSAQSSGATEDDTQISEHAAELGFDIKKLESIDRKMDQLIKSEKVVGCSALILKEGKEVYFGKWGNQNKRKKIPLDRNTIFRIYSMTKPITSIAAMQLVEQGKLDLDKPIATYLPEFADLKVLETRAGESVEVAPKRIMTTRDLMRHTSGLTYGFFGNTAVDQRYRKSGVMMTERTIKSTVEKLGKIPLLHHPGTKFHYGASTDVLGRVIEVVSGQEFDEYLNENVFEPLGMTDTFFSVPTAKQDRFAQLYRHRVNGKLIPASPIQSCLLYTSPSPRD